MIVLVNYSVQDIDNGMRDFTDRHQIFEIEEETDVPIIVNDYFERYFGSGTHMIEKNKCYESSEGMGSVKINNVMKFDGNEAMLKKCFTF